MADSGAGPSVAGAEEAAPVRGQRKAVDREAAFLEQKRLDALRRERKQQLDRLHEAERQARGGDDAPEDTIESRLQLLMRQLDVYAGAMHGEAGAGGGGAARADDDENATGRRKAGRMTEKQEDALLLQTAEDAASATHAPGTRLTVQPKSVTGQMRAYQLEGLNWLVRLFDNGVNGILADEMGLGKTLQTLSLLSYLKQHRAFPGPHLVIVPKSTLGNWARECARWTPDMVAFKFAGDKDAREELRKGVLASGDFDICITTYEVAISEKSAIKRIKWRCAAAPCRRPANPSPLGSPPLPRPLPARAARARPPRAPASFRTPLSARSYVIIDEAHRIKNETSVLSQVVRLFECANRLLITGTPLQNNLHELWAMLNFLLPELFSDASDFDAWFDVAGKTNLVADSFVGKLHKILKPFLLRRLKADVEKELLPKKEVKLFVGMSEMQRTWYAHRPHARLSILLLRARELQPVFSAAPLSALAFAATDRASPSSALLRASLPPPPPCAGTATSSPRTSTRSTPPPTACACSTS